MRRTNAMRERARKSAPRRFGDNPGRQIVYRCAEERCSVRACVTAVEDADARAAAIRESGFRELDGKLYCAKCARVRGYVPGK